MNGGFLAGGAGPDVTAVVRTVSAAAQQCANKRKLAKNTSTVEWAMAEGATSRTNRGKIPKAGTPVHFFLKL